MNGQVTAGADGVIKFRCHWTKGAPEISGVLQELNRERERLYAMGLIGANAAGLGFGNISVRTPGTSLFLISGSQTGHLKHLTAEHYAVVTRVDLSANSLWCVGAVQASSESMSHAALYSSRSGAGAVVHVHSPMLWQKWNGIAVTTAEDIPYGTPEMANALGAAAASIPESSSFIVMGGHRDGLISFAPTLEEASEIFLKLLAK